MKRETLIISHEWLAENPGDMKVGVNEPGRYRLDVYRIENDKPTDTDWTPITSKAEFEIARKLGVEIQWKDGDDWQRPDAWFYWADHEYRARMPK